MAVPDFQTVMRPLLQLLADGDAHPITTIRTQLATHFELTADDLAERIPSGRVTTFQSRVGWATTHLYNTGLIARPKRAVYRITDRGREVLAHHPERVDLAVLSQFPEYAEFRGAGRSRGASSAAPVVEAEPGTHTPEEQIEEAFLTLRAALAVDLLERIAEQSPAFFEQLVLDVLHATGYGGSRDAAERLGQSGDGGVDGVIREDPLGLDLIYVQAKRWANVVGRPEIQKFFGALHGRRATKGVFITTSGFSREAIEYADGVTPRVILVDGQELAQLMIENSVGVTSARRYDVKRLDLDYFVTDDDASAQAERSETDLPPAH